MNKNEEEFLTKVTNTLIYCSLYIGDKQSKLNENGKNLFLTLQVSGDYTLDKIDKTIKDLMEYKKNKYNESKNESSND